MVEDESEVWKWFVAAYLHDLGKTNLNEQGVWENHEHLERTPFAELLPPDLMAKISKHHDKIDIHNGSQSLEDIALIMADKCQKAMHGTEDLEKDNRLGKLRHHPAFYPYYGQIEEGWNHVKAAGLIEQIKQVLKKGRSLARLLDLDDKITRFPHTTYLPHLSLALHHRFSALLLYFLLKRMKSGLSPNKLEVSVITVTPESMPLFYRLRDVESHRKAIYFLRTQVFQKVFREDQGKLPGLDPRNNPFEFFDRGNTLVFVYDEPDKIMRALQSIVDEKEFLRCLTIEVTGFLFEAKLKGEGSPFCELSSDGSRLSYGCLFSKKTLDYPAVSIERCVGCNKPGGRLVLDIKGDMLCPSCLEVRHQERDQREVVDIHQVSLLPNGEEGKVAYVFLTLKEPLYQQATEIAEKLLTKFANNKLFNHGILRPTKGGLFEYLQAVNDVQAFQDKVEEVIADFRKKKPQSAYTLLKFPTLMVYLMGEEHYWTFLGFLNGEREKLRLPNSLRGIVCHAKTPFWSLMDRFTSYDVEDYYYDVTERSVIMFNKEEVDEIRKLASIAQHDWRSSNQLVALSKFALNRGLEELLLEIDVRSGQGKLPRSLPKLLIEALGKIHGDNPRDQTKRAKFIDYVAKLARAQHDSEKRR